MANQVFSILLIEDDETHIEQLKSFLSFSPSSAKSPSKDEFACTLSIVNNVEQAMVTLNEGGYDAIILDLTLPDTDEFEGLLEIRHKFVYIPIIIKIADQDESLIVRGFQLGANGYIKIKELDRNLLVYALKIAIERQQYIQQASEQQQQKEFADLELLASYIQPSITARMFGSSALKDTVPDVFAQLTVTYGEVLDRCLEERIFKVEYDISSDLRSLAAKLGFLKASPRDVVALHTKALKEKCDNVNLAKVQAYVEEGRLRLLELMGYLTSYYRKYYIGLNNLNVVSNPDLENK